MADYQINPPPPIEVEKAELVTFVLDLNKAYKAVTEVQRSLPYGPGNIVIKDRLTVAQSLIKEIVIFINQRYL